LLNVKGVSVIAGIIAVIVIVVLMPIKPGDVAPPITDSSNVVDDASMEKDSQVTDSSNVVDDASMEKDSQVTDSPDITDTAVTENDEGLDYYIDENGTKHFIIDVKDIPSMEG